MKRALQTSLSTFTGSLCLGLVLTVLSSGPAGAVSSDEDRLFRLASHDKDNGTVRQLLAEGVSPNVPAAFDGRTAVHNAAKGGAAKNLAVMLQAGGKPNVQDRDGDTPLHLASRGSFSGGFSDHPAAVRVLLQHGADLHRTNNSGETPLHVAVFTGVSAAHVGVIKALLDAGARPSAVDGNGLTVLQRFSRHSENNGAIVRLLLQAGADPDQKDPQGDAPLHAAIKTGGSYGKAEVVEALLDGGANPCVRDARGYTPYQMSYEQKRIHRVLDRAGGADASYAGGQGCWWDDGQRTDRVETDQTSDDSSEMGYEAALRALEEGTEKEMPYDESGGSDDSSEMTYMAELRALEEGVEARRAEEARRMESAQRAEEARRGEEARRAEKARKTEEVRTVEEARRQEEQRSNKALHASLPPSVARLEQQMVTVQGGTFTMGCTDDQKLPKAAKENAEKQIEGARQIRRLGYSVDSDVFRIEFYSLCYDTRLQAHEVQVNSFMISKYEVTQALWEAVMGTNPSHFQGCAQCPVESVGWNDVQVFLEKLNALTSDRYRLPTEAEWEYAARGGQQSLGYYYAGAEDDNRDSVAWSRYNSEDKVHQVAQKQPNELGLYDMSGNVEEWVEDCWNESYRGAPTDGRAWQSGDCSRRVLRGSSWRGNVSTSFSTSFRYEDDAGIRNDNSGFRVARTLTP